MENQQQQPRRLSGRSISIDKSISMLREIIAKRQLDELDTDIVNNTLPDEIRLIAWKICLEILPIKNFETWVEISEKQRKSFQNLTAEHNIEEAFKNLKIEDGLKTKIDGVCKYFELCHYELGKLAVNYDFFKSQIVAESILKLFLIYLKNCKECQQSSEENIKAEIYILAALYYSLYPSILHFSDFNKLENNTDDPKWLFYYLNDEEFFDCDVYYLFTEIIKHKNLNRKIANSQFVNAYEHNFQKQCNIKIDLDNDDGLIYYLLSIINPGLNLNRKNLVLSKVTANWKNTLLTTVVSFDRLVYFWDNIFFRSSSLDNKLEFLNYINIALINNMSSELISCNGDRELLLLNYPSHKVDEKEIIKKAMKLNERLYL
jgi:hypothetical protein